MNAGVAKRKTAPSAGLQQVKKKKTGNNGKWTTPHQARMKGLTVQRGNVEPGEVGIWATCARGMEGKAARELQVLFDQFGEKMYDIQPVEEQWAKSPNALDGSRDADEDVESLMKKEIESLTSTTPSEKRVFTPIRLNVECLLFTKTRPPVNPVEFVHRICSDAKKDADAGLQGSRTASRYLNRLTPITASGRATEKGVEEVARLVLPLWFTMKGDKSYIGRHSTTDEKLAYSFAIRLSNRHHHTLKRNDVIDKIASLIDDQRHKVDLEAPDKVILVDIFKSTCGMSVVDGDWAELKRYNLSEIYSLPLKSTLSKDKTSVAAPEDQVQKEVAGEWLSNDERQPSGV